MRKILLSVSALFAFGLTASAQVFSWEHDSMTVATTGNTPPSGQTYDNYAITFSNYMVNETSSPLTLQWQFIDADFPDTDWHIYSICDNVLCYYENDPAIANFSAKTTDAIPVGDKGLFKLQVAVPVEAANGTGIVRARAYNIEQSDTSVYIINKTPVGVNTVKIDDNRVSIFPNPGTANATVNVFVNKALNAKEFVVVNVLGAQVAHQAIKGEVSTLATANLAQGNYLIKILDKSGNVITTRKWAK